MLKVHFKQLALEALPLLSVHHIYVLILKFRSVEVKKSHEIQSALLLCEYT